MNKNVFNMNKSQIVNSIENILHADNISRKELSYDEQHVNINVNLMLLPTRELIMLYNRAVALNNFYHNKRLTALTSYTTARSNRDFIQEFSFPNETDIATPSTLKSLIKLVESYGTTTVNLSIESGDWNEENDGFVIAPKSYLLTYYQEVPSLEKAIKEVPCKYIEAENRQFYPVILADVHAELQGLAAHIADHANYDNTAFYYYNQEL